MPTDQVVPNVGNAQNVRNTNHFNGWKTACTILLFCVASALVGPAQTLTTLASFNHANGAGPAFGSLVQGIDGNFYGTTDGGGANGDGTIFRITPAGVLTTLYSFCNLANCTDGRNPFAGLIQASDGNFYGTTYTGGLSVCPDGAASCGTVFRITPGGAFTTLYSFCAQTNCADGANPYAGLIQGSDGNFYGATTEGGANDAGTVFKLTPKGTLTTLFSFFCDHCTGGGPAASLIQATDGNFYGTTEGCCSNLQGYGTVFRITPGGLEGDLYDFIGGKDGADPRTLVQGTDGFIYGTTAAGGVNNGGTFFRVTPSGNKTTLYNFCFQTNCAAGGNPIVAIQGPDGNFYGTTAINGLHGGGTVFKITARGVLTTLYSFCAQTNCTDGADPVGGLTLGTDGNFYGTTSSGGTSNDGTVFKLAFGFAPFVEAQPGFAKVGASIIILGTNLTGSTNVSFNGTPATFTVVSSSEITANVPAGATTGKIQVTTPSGTLSSNAAFRVTPQVLSFSPTSGAVGTSVVITGQSLTDVKAVSFHGTHATSFTVNSDTQITATVPTGATTGWIAVAIDGASGGRGQSSASFTVTP